ncbi:MAG TPA: GNAT family N-acetyltransferase [Candidatus Acidoferrales bacterium]|nr:GNAT family N-acetyltransferase [Candidatus Acidoferrales bacterium]
MPNLKLFVRILPPIRLLIKTSQAMTSKIRPALAGDAPAIGALAQQFAGYLRALGDPSDFNLTAETCLRDGFGAQPAFAGIVAEDNGIVVGYLLYHFGYDSDAAARLLFIADLYVETAARRRGIGRALVARAAAIARETGAKEMVWSVYPANRLAADFYKKLGAQPISEVFFMKLQAAAL